LAALIAVIAIVLGITVKSILFLLLIVAAIVLVLALVSRAGSWGSRRRGAF